MLLEQQTIGEIIRKLESNYISGETVISEYVSFSQYQNIQKIEAYLNSKFLSGDTDSTGFQKAFFNICTAAANIWYRATDLDRKDIRIKADSKKNFVTSFLANLKFQEWMRKVNFGAYLNDWGRTKARYGSAVTKFVEKDGELKISVVPWNRLISDTVDFENNPKIERLFVTPAQLRENPAYDQEQVELLIEAQTTRKTLRGQQRDNKADYIELFEIHGNLSLALLTDKENDEDTYQQQMHIYSYVAGKGKGDFDDFTLYSGREKQDPYYLSTLIKEDGRAMGIGAVEHLFEAQWQTNDTIHDIRKQLLIASRLFLQTSDTTFTGRNSLINMQNGDILVHKVNEPLTQVNNGSHDLTSLQNFSSQWKGQAMEVTSTPEATRGINPPSNQPLGTTEIITTQGLSLFEIMIENGGIDIENQMRKYILPHIKKQLDTTDEIAAILDANDIKQLDSMYIPNEVIRRVNQQILNSALNGRIENNIDPQAEAMRIQQELSQLGNQRFIKPSDIKDKTWKDIFKDFEWEAIVNVTNESQNKGVILTSLTTTLQTIAGFAGRPMSPQEELVFSKIMEETGVVSPLELAQSASQSQQQAQMQQAQAQQIASQPPNQVGGGVGVKPNQSVV